MSNVVGDLIDDGLVAEAGAMESEGGRPSILLRVAPGYGAVAGVDVGETRVRVELFDLGLTQLACVDQPIDPTGTSPETVVKHIAARLAAAAREPVARAVLDETADYLGAGVANLINLFNPELVVLGGWTAVALATLLPRVRESARRHALRQPFAQARIELGRLGDDAVALGAATLPIARLLTEGGVRPSIG